MRVFVTSDMFFGRQKTAEDRGFKTSDEMEDAIIERWNQKVKESDLVYHLGNFSWDPISGETVLPYLNGKIVFGSGLYDRHLGELSRIVIGQHSLLTQSINVLRDIPISRKKTVDLVVSYWPLLDWPGKDDGIIHLHGGNIPSDLDSGSRFCVGCDRWELRPIEVDSLIDIVAEHRTASKK